MHCCPKEEVGGCRSVVCVACVCNKTTFSQVVCVCSAWRGVYVLLLNNLDPRCALLPLMPVVQQAIFTFEIALLLLVQLLLLIPLPPLLLQQHVRRHQRCSHCR